MTGNPSGTSPAESIWSPRLLLPTLSVTLGSGVIFGCLVMSRAALIFSGNLTTWLPLATSAMFLGSAVLLLVVGLASSLPGAICSIQDASTIILVAATTTTLQGLPPSAHPAEILATIMALIILSTLLTGMLFLTLGRMRLTYLLRFIPYPVIGGFLAATGWMLMVGALGLAANLVPSLTNTIEFFHGPAMLKSGAAILWAVSMLLVTKKYRHYLVMPGGIILGLIIFYLIARATGVPQARLAVQGWLILSNPSEGIWPPFSMVQLGPVDWSVIRTQSGQISMVAILSAISLILNVRGLEIVTNSDVDLDQEMIAAGLANVLAGFFGCPAGYQSLASTTLTHRFGAANRFTPVLLAVFCILIVIVGPRVMSFIPTFLLSGLILFLGLSFLEEWLYRSWFTLPKIDYALVLIIMVITGFFGFLTGVAVGLTITATLFVFNFSRTDPVKNIFDRGYGRSTVKRPPAQDIFLNSVGEQILIMRLQGYLFFGSAHNLFDQVRREIDPGRTANRRVMILDFSLVTGFDSSATHLLLRMTNFCQARAMLVIFTQVNPPIKKLFEQSGLLSLGKARIFPSLDLGLEWAEDHLIGDMARAVTGLKGPLGEIIYDQTMRQLAIMEMFEKLTEKAGECLEAIPFEAGTVIRRQGHPSAGACFLIRGQVAAWLEKKDGSVLRLGLLKPVTVFGENALYGIQPSPFTMAAVEAGAIHQLSPNQLKYIQENHPELLTILHEFIAICLEERLACFSEILRLE